MDKNEKLWFSAKKPPTYHNILWSEEFKDTRCSNFNQIKSEFYSPRFSDDDYRKFLDVQEELRHA